MYAIVEAGGKQHRVEEGDILTLDRIEGDEGATVDFERVLLVGDANDTTIGKPVVEGAKVSAKILEQTRDKKKIVFRFKNKQRYRVKKGHRQPITRVQIESIQH